MFEGWLGEPFYGMEKPKAADSRQEVGLPWPMRSLAKTGKRIKGRPGEHAAKVDLKKVAEELEGKLKRKPTEDDVVELPHVSRCVHEVRGIPQRATAMSPHYPRLLITMAFSRRRKSASTWRRAKRSSSA